MDAGNSLSTDANRDEPASVPDVTELGQTYISREQAIEAAKRLVAKYEQLDDIERVDIAGAAKEAFLPSRVLLTPEMSEDDPEYTTAPADFSTCNI